MIDTRVGTVAFVGYGSPNDLVLVTTPAGSAVDPKQGISLEEAQLWVGRDGDSLTPLVTEYNSGRNGSFIGTEA